MNWYERVIDFLTLGRLSQQDALVQLWKGRVKAAQDSERECKDECRRLEERIANCTELHAKQYSSIREQITKIASLESRLAEMTASRDNWMMIAKEDERRIDNMKRYANGLEKDAKTLYEIQDIIDRRKETAHI